ncbi:MAG: RsbRD N-terminal domain-containing protein, partial [Vicinamibacteraceae bacterium]
MPQSDALVLDIIQQDSSGLLADWLAELKARGTGADHRITESELHEQGAELLQLLGPALSSGTDVNAEPWRPVREFLE